MTESVRQQLPVIAVVCVAGIATCYLAFTALLGSVGSLDVGTFERAVFLVPCAIMLVGSLAIALTARQIGRQLYMVVVSICIALGVVCMVLASMWEADPAISAALLANSDAGAELVPPVNSPIVVLRDIAAFFVVPTVGCIAGAWLGSRIHPMISDGAGRKRKKNG